MIHILIADDHAVVRTGLKQILAAEFRDARFGEASTAVETEGLLRQRRWDVALLDAELLDGDAALLRRLPPRAGHLPILAIGRLQDSQLARHTLEAGADGYIAAASAPHEWVQAVKNLLGGGHYVSPALAVQWFTQPAAAHDRLSDREVQVLRRIAGGKALKEIAADLSVSVKTVSTYRARLLEKLHLRSNVDILRYALQHKLAD